MAATRSAAAKIDWAGIGNKLGLRGNTAQALAAFKKRNDDARRRVQVLSEQPQNVDLGHYRSVLKNTKAVDEVESHMKAYKIQTYDVSKQIKSIESFEVQAVKSAEETAKAVEAELKDLSATLNNIESARPFEDCTIEDITTANPEVERKVEHHVKNHRWMPAGYKEQYGDLALL